MKLLVYSRPGSLHEPGELKALSAALLGSGLDYAFHKGLAGEIIAAGIQVTEGQTFSDFTRHCTPGAIAVSFGGDGTFLECVRLIGDCPLPVLGINSGRLGFLANVPQDGIEAALTDLRCGLYRITPRTLIKVSGDLGPEIVYPFAFNEFTVQRNGPGMISVETYIDDEMVATYWGDGVIISTPAGSTAYSLSVGGPVVAPDCGCFVLSPIAPHNLTMRPVVIPDTSTVSFGVGTRDGVFLATLDNTSCEASDGARFSVRKAEKIVNLIELQNISFYDTLRNKMLWGIDRRESDDRHRKNP